MRQAPPIRRWITWGLLGLVAVVGVEAGCSRKGLVKDTYDKDFYEIPRTIPGTVFDRDAPFVFCGDNRTGWRVVQKFASRQAWVTWWQLAIPFYQLYLLGNGFVGGVNFARAVPDYGEKEARVVRDAIYQEARSGGADFIVLAGDIVTDGRRPRNWRTFLEQYKVEVPVVTEFPFFPIIGNHEWASDSTYGLPNYNAVFDYPSFYVIETPSADIFCVDSDLVVDQWGYIDDDAQDRLFNEWFVTGDPSRPAWLESKLRSSGKPNKIVAMHHSLISFGEHSDDWYTEENGRDLVGKRKQLIEMMYANGVRLVLTSHDHQYQRNVLHMPSGDMVFIVSGGAGTPIRRGSSVDKRAAIAERFERDGLDVECVSYHNTHHYCVVHPGPDAIEVEATEVPAREDQPTRVIDTVTVGRPD